MNFLCGASSGSFTLLDLMVLPCSSGEDVFFQFFRAMSYLFLDTYRNCYSAEKELTTFKDILLAGIV